MFWLKKKKAQAGKTTLTDASIGKSLLPRQTPGYYPGLCTLSQQKYWDSATRDLVHKRVTEPTPVRFFTPEEARTMAAVCGRIVPQEDRIPATRIDILAGIDKRLHENRIEGYRYEDMPSDEEAYRLAARAFEAMARESRSEAFHDLPTIEQERLIKSVHDAQPLAGRSFWKKMNVIRFWSMLVTDCCSIYYAHPYAWDEIGFGGPAYPRGYMRLEEGEPEPWEVDEQRYEWNAPADTLSDREETPDSGERRRSHHDQAGAH